MFNTIETQAMSAFILALVHQVRDRRGDERGAAEIATIVIVTAIIAAGAIAITTAIVLKFTDKAETIPTQ